MKDKRLKGNRFSSEKSKSTSNPYKPQGKNKPSPTRPQSPSPGTEPGEPSTTSTPNYVPSRRKIKPKKEHTYNHSERISQLTAIMDIFKLALSNNLITGKEYREFMEHFSLEISQNQELEVANLLNSVSSELLLNYFAHVKFLPSKSFLSRKMVVDLLFKGPDKSSSKSTKKVRK